MQIIEKLPDDQFERVCDAGVDLVRELVALLERNGIGLDQASNVLAVAAAGVTVSSGLSSEDFAAAVVAVKPYWKLQERDGEEGVFFDPAHRQVDYVAPARDMGSAN